MGRRNRHHELEEQKPPSSSRRREPLPARSNPLPTPTMLSLLLALQLAAQPADTAHDAHPNGFRVPRVRAVRVERPPVIDGRLDDEVWGNAPVHSGFVQVTPAEGAPATQGTEVRIAYDDGALYIAARMFESEPARIRRELARHDAGDEGDLFIVALDSYHDHLGAFGFAMNPSGVRIDAIASKDEENWDTSWDPVWQGASQIDSIGWTAEMRIPLSQLRFPPRGEQLWGVNFWRNHSSRKENNAFVLVKQSERGFASRFAHLVGISDIPIPRRLEALPYVRGQAETRSAVPGDPFFDGSRFSQAVGMDVKYGVTSNLTLDATINPDFGQVEADPAQLNLTAFETFFQERRPFFVEGSQIFDFGAQCNDFCFSGAPQLFYSRRMGRQPSLGPRVPFIGTGSDPLAVHEVMSSYTDVPTHSPILGAAKLTGQLIGGTSIGLLHAETGRVDGRVDALVREEVGSAPSRLRYEDPIEPRAHYSVLRLRQDFNGGATTVGVLGTSVIRDLSTDAMRNAMTRSAMVAGVDARHRWSKNRFDAAASMSFSRVRGSTAAILDEQNASARYFGRPDQNYVRVDPTRRSLSGYQGQASFVYTDPRGPFASLRGQLVAPAYESNDFGFMNQADYRNASLVTGWRRPRPGKIFRNQSVDLFSHYSENLGGEVMERFAGIGMFNGFTNGWGTGMFVLRGTESQDVFVSEGGPAVRRPAFTMYNFNVSSDDSKPLTGFLFGELHWDDLGKTSRAFGGQLGWRPATNISISLGPHWNEQEYHALFVRNVSDPQAPSATYGTRYVFGEALRRSVSVSTRVNVTFTPNLSFELFAQPFVAEARYDPSRFKELARGGTFEFTRYGTDAGSTITRYEEPAPSNCSAPSFCYRVDPDGGGPAPDFTFRTPDRTLRSLRGTSVLRWEYRPGATLFVVWTQGREQSLRAPGFGGMSEFSSLFSLAPENVFLVKLSYWLSR